MSDERDPHYCYTHGRICRPCPSMWEKLALPPNPMP